MGIRLQDRAELKEWMTPNTVTGTEPRDKVLKALGLITKNSTTSEMPKYIRRNGQVWKWKNGVLVALTKVAK